jgi:lactoylglutathione lyase
VDLGVNVDYQEHSWGAVAKFFDPDGNLCALRDDETFEQHIGTFA